jgi:hypothetical protein
MIETMEDKNIDISEKDEKNEEKSQKIFNNESKISQEIDRRSEGNFAEPKCSARLPSPDDETAVAAADVASPEPLTATGRGLYICVFK